MSSHTPRTALKLASELFVVPGSSLFMEGELGPGAAHAVAGLIGYALFGLPAVALIGARSYLRSLARARADLARAGARDPALEDLVREQLRQGMTLDEIRAGFAEDIEDIYHELQRERGPR